MSAFTYDYVLLCDALTTNNTTTRNRLLYVRLFSADYVITMTLIVQTKKDDFFDDSKELKRPLTPPFYSFLVKELVPVLSG
mmetsp:Transcript_56986/g.84819  ORF Transcript_56986/g.84819 Transcript_56986/m.84819 type:complete len:81 (-) Transcript_56986:826-1068(-)